MKAPKCVLCGAKTASCLGKSFLPEYEFTCEKCCCYTILADGLGQIYEVKVFGEYRIDINHPENSISICNKYNRKTFRGGEPVRYVVKKIPNFSSLEELENWMILQ